MISAQAGKSVVLIASKANTSSVTTTASFDTKGADYALVTVNLGVEKNTNAIGPTITVKEGDTTSSYATWSSDCTVTGANGDLETAHSVSFLIDTKYRKRYIELTCATGTATNDDVVWGAMVSLSSLAEKPSSTSEMVGASGDVVKLL